MNQAQLAELDKRMADFLSVYMKLAFLGEMPDVGAYHKAMIRMLADAGELRLEVGRLTGQRQQIRDLHVPMESGATAICTGCSIGGTLAPWPCPTWKLTDTP